MNTFSGRTVFVDTSALAALINRHDQHHSEAVAIHTRLVQQKMSGVISNFVLAETHALLIVRVGSQIAREWLIDFDMPIYRITPEDEEKAVQIIRQYKESSFSYCDACSFGLMERLELQYAFAFDSHFREYGFITLEPDTFG